MLLSRAFRLRNRTTRSHLWALRGVDLDVAAGEAVGVIGRNGAGKSTMLRLLAGITAPTEGTVRVAGRVAPLISVGVGFHPELSGRENVFVNGTVLGMTKAEITRRFDAIVDFAELSSFIDTPVKFYSSGMFVRLGFSVAVASRPDVLLVDEVLAVGDIGFQMRCYERMDELRADGTTMLVVSHNLTAVRNMCERVLVIRSGQPVFLGPPEEAITAYYAQVGDIPDEDGPVRTVAAPAVFESFALTVDGQETGHVHTGDVAEFRAEVVVKEPLDNPTFGFLLLSGGGVPVYADSTWNQGTRRYEPGERVEVRIKVRLPLVTGAYTARPMVRWGPGDDARLPGPSLSFHVAGRTLVTGVTDLGATFEFD